MKKTILVYGVISGAIIIGSIILGLALEGASEQMAALEWLGYLIMIIAFSAIFVGIKRHRDQQQGGVIKFATAFLVGLGITVVASVIYCAAWEVNLAVTDHAFINEYTQSVIDGKTAEGVSSDELEAVVAKMDALKQQYSNPLYRIPITFLEIFPVGLIITLLSAAILRNSKVLPATQA